jgi:hypothetical protein
MMRFVPPFLVAYAPDFGGFEHKMKATVIFTKPHATTRVN